MPGENVSRKFLVFPSGKDEFVYCRVRSRYPIVQKLNNICRRNQPFQECLLKMLSLGMLHYVQSLREDLDSLDSHDIPHSGASISNQWQFIVIRPMGSTHRIYTLLPKQRAMLGVESDTTSLVQSSTLIYTFHVATLLRV